MASMTRRIRRLMNNTSRQAPQFTLKEWSSLDEPTRNALAQKVAEVTPDEPAPEPTPAPAVVEPTAKASGTYCTLNGTEHGPFKNQAEAKESIKAALGVTRMPAGAAFSRV